MEANQNKTISLRGKKEMWREREKEEVEWKRVKQGEKKEGEECKSEKQRKNKFIKANKKTDN